MSRKLSAGVVVLAALGIVLAGCRSQAPQSASNAPATSPQSKAPSSTELTGAGATFPYPIYSKWFDVYGKQSGVRINYQSIGSGGGIQQLKAKTVDFGASDAPLSDAEMKEMPAPVVHIPTVAGAVAITYNLPGIDKGLRLGPDVLADIFLGKITKWDDPRLMALNPSLHLPGTAIAVAHRSDGSGTSFLFTSYLTAVSKDWAGKVGAGKSVSWPAGIGGKGNEGVAGILKQTPGAIGYVELAYAIQNKLPYAELQNQAGEFVAPSIASTTAAAAGAAAAMKKDVRVSIVNSAGKGAYPIAGFTYLLVYQQQTDAQKGAELVKLLNWCVTEGQQYAAGLDYAPLPAEVRSIDQQQIARITNSGKAS